MMIGIQDWKCIEKQPENHSLLIHRPGMQRDGDPTPRGRWQDVDSKYAGRVDKLARDEG